MFWDYSFFSFFVGGSAGAFSFGFSSAGVSSAGASKSDSNFFVPSFRTLELIWTVSREISFPRTVFLSRRPFGFLLNFFSPFGFFFIPFP